MRTFFVALLLLLPVQDEAWAGNFEDELRQLTVTIASAFSPESTTETRREGVRAIVSDLPLAFLVKKAFGTTLGLQPVCVRKHPKEAILAYLTSDEVINYLAGRPVESYALTEPRQIADDLWVVTTLISRPDHTSRSEEPRSHRYSWYVQRIDGVLKITNLSAHGFNLRELLTRYVQSHRLPCPRARLGATWPALGTSQARYFFISGHNSEYLTMVSHYIRLQKVLNGEHVLWQWRCPSMDSRSVFLKANTRRPERGDSPTILRHNNLTNDSGSLI
jgi:hypothetical protein